MEEVGSEEQWSNHQHTGCEFSVQSHWRLHARPHADRHHPGSNREEDPNSLQEAAAVGGVHCSPGQDWPHLQRGGGGI